MGVLWEDDVAGSGEFVFDDFVQYDHWRCAVTALGTMPNVIDEVVPRRISRVGWVASGAEVVDTDDVSRWYYFDAEWLDFEQHLHPAPFNSQFLKSIRWQLKSGAAAHLSIWST